MKIGGVDLVSYLTQLEQTQTVGTQQTKVATDNGNSDTDSYIPSVASADMVIPSGTYNSKGLEVGTDYYGSNNESGSTSTQTQESSSAVGGAGGGGGSSDSDSDEDTQTQIVTIDGVTYLQTTTTDENGNTTVTRTQIGTASVTNE
jgi:hypothetical protein